MATAVYDDKWRPIFEAIGPWTVPRGTDVEFEAGEWIARLRATGEIVARSPNRSEVIAAEGWWLNAYVGVS